MMTRFLTCRTWSAPILLACVCALSGCARTGTLTRQWRGDGRLEGIAPDVSPDGQTVIFTGLERRPHTLKVAWIRPSLQAGDVYATGLDGQRPTRLTNDPAYDGMASFSPDGRRIVFVSERVADTESEIWLMDRDGGNPVRLTHNFRPDRYPFFSPDGRRIVYTGLIVPDAEGRPTDARRADADRRVRAVFSIRPDGSDERQLTFPKSVGKSSACSAALWSRNGDRIAFIAEGPQGTLWIMEPDGDGKTQQNLPPLWVHHGLQCDLSRETGEVVVKTRDQGLTIWNPESGATRMILPNRMGRLLWPRWLPEAERLLVHATPLSVEADTPGALWTLGRDGRNWRKIIDVSGLAQPADEPTSPDEAGGFE